MKEDKDNVGEEIWKKHWRGKSTHLENQEIKEKFSMKYQKVVQKEREMKDHLMSLKFYKDIRYEIIFLLTGL